MLLLRN